MKCFLTGKALPAETFQDYLMNIFVMSFAISIESNRSVPLLSFALSENYPLAR